MAVNAPELDLRDEIIDLLQKSLAEAKAVAEKQAKIGELKVQKEKSNYAAMLAKIAEEHQKQAHSIGNGIEELNQILNPMLESGKINGENLAIVTDLMRDLGAVVRRMPTPTVTNFLEQHYIPDRCLEADTQRHVENYIRLFAKATGNRELGLYKRGDIVKWVRILEKLKQSYGRGKPIEAQTIQEIIQASKGNIGLNRTTIEKHITHLKGFFKFAAKQIKFATSDNIDDLFDDIRLSDHVPDPRPRKVWTIKHLNALFASPLWSGTRRPREEVTKRHEPGPQIHVDAYWWLPITALWTGARLEEMAQLHAEDLLFDVDKLPFLRIHDEGIRRLKNGNSIRNVPIHPFLVELGFLKLFERKKATRIFPELKPHGRPPKIGGLYSSHFTDYRKAIDNYEELRDFHSFRRTFITTMYHRAKVDMLTIAQIAGHDPDEPNLVRVKQTNDYTDYSVSDLREAIGKLDYEALGLDVTFLRHAALACSPAGTTRVDHLPSRASPV